MQENVKTIAELLGASPKMDTATAGKITVHDLTKHQTQKLCEICFDFTIKRSGTGLTVIFTFEK